jgi:hypothetical protein
MFTKKLPKFGTGLKHIGQLMAILIISIFTITTFFSTTVSAQPMTDDEIKADIVKDGALFTPEFIQKADKYVTYDDEGNALVLNSLEKDNTLTKEEQKLLKKAIRRFNLLSKAEKKESKNNKEKFGHPSQVYSWLEWWGMRSYWTGSELYGLVSGYQIAYSVMGGLVSTLCSAGYWACQAIIAGIVAAASASAGWCKDNRGFMYVDINYGLRSSYWC